MEKFRDRRDDGALHLRRELWINRERERFARGPFRLRQVAFAITEISETFLLVEPERIINCRANLAGGEMFLQLVAARSADHVLMIDVVMGQAARAVGLGRERDRVR